MQPVSVTFVQPQTNGTDNYNLYFDVTSGSYGVGPFDGGPAGEWTVILQPLTTYYLTSTAWNAAGESEKGLEYVYTTTAALKQKVILGEP